MKHLIHAIAICCLLACSAIPARAQTSYPMLMSLQPTAAQVGTDSEHEVESRYSMFGAYQVIVHGEGVTGEIITPMELGKDGKEPSLTKIKVKFHIAADAIPGVRDFRIIGPTGASTLGQLLVTPNPVVYEAAKNDTPDLAQAVELPATICGTVEKGEDVDFFKFTIDQPKTVNFLCWGMRLEDKIHDLQTHVDPIITVKSAATGSTVAAANNQYAADPFLSHHFEHPGEYLLEVRDVRYSGNRYWQYAIETSSRPFVSNVHPTAVSVGSEPGDVELVGAGLPAEKKLVKLSLAENASAGSLDVQLPMGDDQKTNPVSVVVSSLPRVVESAEENNEPATAQPVTIPCGISGRIEKEADVDCYVFDAKKGDRVSLQVIARRNWSQLDSIVRILKEDGAPLSENDDLREWNRINYQDSEIENWAAPADGKYIVEIRDVHLRGGDGYVYFLQVEHSQPYFELSTDMDKSWLTPGTCSAIFVRAVKKNGFDGEIQLHIDGLPEGVTAHTGRILAGAKQTDGCIILEASPDAKPLASNVRIYGTATADNNGTPLELTIDAKPMQEVYFPGGGRGHFPVEMHTVAVGTPSDVRKITLSTYALTLKPGESQTITVDIERAEGFDKNVTLDMLYRHLSSMFADTLPVGVTIDAKKSKTLLTGKNSSGNITLTAAKDAPACEPQQCCVMANVSLNFVMKATYSSQPLLITVAAEEKPAEDKTAGK